MLKIRLSGWLLGVLPVLLYPLAQCRKSDAKIRRNLLSCESTRQCYPDCFLSKFCCALRSHSRSPFAHNTRLKERHNSATGPHTHNITVFVGEQLFANDHSFFGPREKRAALRMLDVMKRQSQESTVLFGVKLRPTPVRSSQRIRGLSLIKFKMTIQKQPARLPVSIRNASVLTVTKIAKSRVRLTQLAPHLSLNLTAGIGTVKSIKITSRQI